MASQKPEGDPAPREKTVEHWETRWTTSLHVFVLAGFAVAQPLFDLLSRQAEFFAFRQTTWADITVLVLILSVLLPLCVIGAEAIIGLLSSRLRRWVHGAVIAAGVAATLLPALHSISAPGTLLVAGALLLGGLAALGYVFLLPVRQFFSLLSPAVLIFPGLFVFASPVFRIVFPADAATPVERVQIPDPPPIVFIILDEFPTTSLLNEHHQIDAVRYPNFAALARNATWFRNTTTVSISTDQSVPAILTGKYPGTDQRLPHATDYPYNLFTLLAGTYDLNAFGALTQLCPAHLCTRAGSVYQHLPPLLSDLTVVYLHLLLPPDLRTTLPSISQNWMHFTNDPDPHSRKAAQFKELWKVIMPQPVWADRRQQGLDFIKAIQPTDQPHLYFLHLLLPHYPYTYLPSGKVYNRETSVPGVANGWRTNDIYGVRQLYQRHLLQVGFVDTWLGELLTHLRKTGLYDQTLLVITADHGISFQPSAPRRGLIQTTLQDMLPVPLFIKAPSQQHGGVNDQPLETVDILPTLAAILKGDLPWEIDGCSAFGPCAERVRRFYPSLGKPVTLNDLAPGLKRAVQRQHHLFGSGLSFPSPLGPSPHLLGKRLEEFDSIGETNVQIKIDHPDRFTAVDLQADFIPTYITGQISPPLRNGRPFSLAVAVNGTIQAVVRPWSIPIQGRHGSWSAVVPESVFQAGQNTIEVFVVSDSAGQATLAHATGVHYRLDRTEVLVTPDGSEIPIVPQALRGYIETPRVSENTVLLKGWAVDEKRAQPAERILIFLNGAFYHAGPTGISRPDIAKWLRQPTFASSGFRYTFPTEPFVSSGTPEVRAFAVSGDSASELNYIEGYPWRSSARR